MKGLVVCFCANVLIAGFNAVAYFTLGSHINLFCAGVSASCAFMLTAPIYDELRWRRRLDAFLRTITQRGE